MVRVANRRHLCLVVTLTIVSVLSYKWKLCFIWKYWFSDSWVTVLCPGKTKSFLYKEQEQGTEQGNRNCSKAGVFPIQYNNSNFWAFSGYTKIGLFLCFNTSKIWFKKNLGVAPNKMEIVTYKVIKDTGSQWPFFTEKITEKNLLASYFGFPWWILENSEDYVAEF